MIAVAFGEWIDWLLVGRNPRHFLVTRGHRVVCVCCCGVRAEEELLSADMIVICLFLLITIDAEQFFVYLVIFLCSLKK